MKFHSIEAELEGAGGLAGRRARVQAAHQALAAARAAQAFAENEVTVQRSKLETTEAALYGGTVRNPKELADLQHEAEALRRHIAILDDRLLEAMLVLEAAETEVRQSTAALETGEAGWSAARAQLERARSELAQQIERLEGEREATLAGVSPADLALYESLRGLHGGTAVAEVLDSSCGACGVAVAPSIVQTVRSSPDLIRCRQCNRILYAG